MPGPAAAVLLAAGLGTPGGFELLKEDTHCRYLVARDAATDWPELRAECWWPEVTPADLHGVLGDWDGYAEHFSTIASSQTVGPLGKGTAVLHVHTAPMMADRQALLLFWTETTGDATAFHWTLAPGQPDVPRGQVQLAHDTGHWTVAPGPDGAGTLVVSELVYDPGGRVPDALVHWFQQAGVAAFVEELYAAVGGS